MRYNSTVFLKKVDHLEAVLGIKLESNVWHKHYSVYARTESGTQKQLVGATNAREACGQMGSILNVLSLKESK